MITKLEHVPARGFWRWFWLCLGAVSFLLGAIGAALPILPTTPFMILAAFCFAKSSKRFHDYLLNHKIFGPAIVDWQTYGGISSRAKLIAVGMMIFILLVSFALHLSMVIIIIQACAMAGSATFILTRPTPPTD